MTDSHSTGHEAEQACIDPRLLVSSGFGVDDPAYDTSAYRLVDSDELSLDNGLSSVNDYGLAIEYMHAREEFHSGACEVSTTGQKDATVTQQHSSDHAADHTAALGSKRPRLTLETSQAKSEVPSKKTPTTPEIRLSGPTDAFVEPIRTRQQAVMTSGRARRNSSPARGPKRLGRQIPLASSVRQGHLSPTSHPTTLETFIRDSYHPGDRFLYKINNAEPHTPVAATATVPTPFLTPSIITEHTARQRTPSGRFVCKVTGCDETKHFDTPNELSKHQRKHLPEAQRPHGCEFCVRRFLFPKDLQRHRKTHEEGTIGKEDDKPRCFICGNVFTREDNLTRHVQSMHGGMPTPSSSGRRRRVTSAASPTTDSMASFSAYSGSRPATPLALSPTMQLFSRPPYIPDPDPFADDPFEAPSSPLVALPMTRSQSDIH